MGVVLLLTLCVRADDCVPQEGKPQQEAPASTNPTYKVDKLFTHDGVTVYRFFDRGNYHYYAVPNTGAPAETTAIVGCGDDCEREEAIRTAARPMPAFVAPVPR